MFVVAAAARGERRVNEVAAVFPRFLTGLSEVLCFNAAILCIAARRASVRAAPDAPQQEDRR
jgi:hypothetical protein